MTTKESTMSSNSDKKSSRKKKSKRSKNKGDQFQLFSAIEQLDIDDSRAQKKISSSNDKKLPKSKAAKSQVDLFTDLMEVRIILQRALHSSLPASNEEDFSTSEEDKILDKMLKARNDLCQLSEAGLDSDSDGNTEGEMDEDDEFELNERRIASGYMKCREQWMKVLNKRHDEIQLHSGMKMKAASQFKVVDQSFWHQVESTVKHDEILNGVNNSATENEPKEKDDLAVSVFEQNSSQFNRTQHEKLYQHQLKDFIKSTTSNTASAASSLSYMEGKNKKKKNRQAQVDRRASKGRKIRYTVNPKLANFTFSVSRPEPFIPEDEWFKSLFGGSSSK